MSTQKTAWLIVACCLLPFASEGLAQGELPGPPRMLTIVVSGEWGVARAADIEKLLSDVASHINGLLRTPWAGEVHVRSAPPSDPTPRTLPRFSKTDPIVIQLACKDRRWNQYAYQFAHEFCHVLSGYEGLEGNPNNWFHETICELASVFTLRRMAERWPTHPPYPNWAGYSKHLLEYAAKRQKREEVQLPIGTTLLDWLSSHESGLRNDRYQRDKNDLVAYALLPVFEEFPAGWNAIRKFPSSSRELKCYLTDWASAADPDDVPFVVRLADMLGHTIGSDTESR